MTKNLMLVHCSGDAGETVIGVSRKNLNGSDYVDVRCYCFDDNRSVKPTDFGVVIPVSAAGSISRLIKECAYHFLEMSIEDIKKASSSGVTYRTKFYFVVSRVTGVSNLRSIRLERTFSKKSTARSKAKKLSTGVPYLVYKYEGMVILDGDRLSISPYSIFAVGLDKGFKV